MDVYRTAHYVVMLLFIIIFVLMFRMVSFPIVRLYRKVMEALQKYLDDEDPRRL